MRIRRLAEGVLSLFPPVAMPVLGVGSVAVTLLTFAAMDGNASRIAGQILLETLGGSQHVEIETVKDILALARWLLVVMPFLLLAGLALERETGKHLQFVLYRMGSFARWWTGLFIRLALGAALYSGWMVILSSLTAIAVVGGNWMEILYVAARLWVLLAVFYCMLAALLCVLHLVLRRPHFPLLLAVAVVLTAMVPVEGFSSIAVWTPGSMGMLLRSSLYQPEGGFTYRIALLALGSSCLALYLIGRIRSKSCKITTI